VYTPIARTYAARSCWFQRSSLQAFALLRPVVAAWCFVWLAAAEVMEGDGWLMKRTSTTVQCHSLAIDVRLALPAGVDQAR
jgi:hypothetical protein